MKTILKYWMFPGIILLFIFHFNIIEAQPKKLTSYVNPFIGTDGFGHTFPGATCPFGMVQLSPDTRTSGWENCSGYHSSNPTIIGFSHTHLSGTGAADYGDILFMATKGVQTMPGDEQQPLKGYRSAFSKETERASPGYYRVMLSDHGIQAEMTATTRCGFHKYTFPASDEAVIITDLVHGISDQVTECEIEITGDRFVSGYRRSKGWARDHVVYFFAEFSKPFIESGITDANGVSIKEKKSNSKTGVKSWAKFKMKNYESVMVKVGISTVSIENARKNLEKEIPAWDFTGTTLAAKNLWENELGRIEVTGGTKEERTNFYTSLYHVMVAPNIMSDIDGSYRGMDGNIHKMERGSMYTVFSLWDTFRALHPLYTIIDPARAQEFVRALLQKYRESGLLPVWELASNETNCMIGYHSVPVIVDTYMKGLRDFDVSLAIEAMQKSAEQDVLGLKYYKSQGYIPADRENESVSRTLEYAYDDWCIAQMAETMGDEETATAFLKRSQSFRNVYDNSTGFMRGKKNGSWVEPFDPSEVSGIYTEANAWQYTWFVPHDIPGLIRLQGGTVPFAGGLEKLFSAGSDLKGRSQPDISGMIGQYAHGNEPSHHLAYLFNWTDSPHRTAELVRRIMKEFYTSGRDGLIGNEDCGQMSAWYVFSAMGFYPVCPGSNEYAFGSPLFNKIVIGPGTGTTFTILADSVSENNKYIQSVSYNGKTHAGNLLHSQLASGGTLQFKMSAEPSGIKVIASTLKEKELVQSPVVASGEKTFLDSTLITLATPTAGAERYFWEGTEPVNNFTHYTEPFYITKAATLRIRAVKEGMIPSYVEPVTFIKLPYRRTVTYTNPYSHLYTAGGDNGLIDGIHGEPEIFGAWQGFEGTDLEVVIDLQKPRSISTINTTFLQQYASWIWLPQWVIFSISNDGKNYTVISDQKNTIDDNKSGSFTWKFGVTVKDKKARYVKISAKNRGVCPAWHPGAGDKAWIFVDEVDIE